MGQTNPKTECAQCGTMTEAPKQWRQKSYCSGECINGAIKDRDRRVAEAAQTKAALDERIDLVIAERDKKVAEAAKTKAINDAGM